MSRHGGQVLAQFPGLLARLASEPCEVALVFSGDRVVALAAWTATGPGQAELLGAYCASLRLAPWAFLFGPQGPIAAAGVERLWLLADGPAQAKDLRRQGFQPTPAGPAAPGAARLERRIGAA
jgi:hypothetical protein